MECHSQPGDVGQYSLQSGRVGVGGDIDNGTSLECFSLNGDDEA